MALSFYNISVPQLDRALAQLQICLAKGSTWCTEKKIDELLSNYSTVIQNEYATVVPLKE